MSSNLCSDFVILARFGTLRSWDGQRGLMAVPEEISRVYLDASGESKQNNRQAHS
jgi:hypothetical protein